MASALASLRCQGGADRHLPLDPGRPRVTDNGGRVDDGPARVDSKHPAAVRMGVSGQPCNGDRVSYRVERAGEFAGVWDRLGEIIRTVEGAGEIDVTDLFNERRALVELDGIQLDGKGCEHVEAVAVGSTGEVRRRGADRTRLGDENRPCGSRREGRGAEHSKGCDAKCTDESSRGPHVHTSKHLSKQASVRPLLSPKHATPELRALAHTHVGPPQGGFAWGSLPTLSPCKNGPQNDATASTVLASSVRDAMPSLR